MFQPQRGRSYNLCIHFCPCSSRISLRVSCFSFPSGRRFTTPIAWLTRETCPMANRSLSHRNDTVVRRLSHQTSSIFSPAPLGNAFIPAPLKPSTPSPQPTLQLPFPRRLVVRSFGFSAMRFPPPPLQHPVQKRGCAHRSSRTPRPVSPGNILGPCRPEKWRVPDCHAPSRGKPPRHIQCAGLGPFLRHVRHAPLHRQHHNAKIIGLININGEVERGGFLAVKELLFVS